MKRTVRQRCGFGCVLCGSPVFDYEHIDGYAETQQHDPDRITLLCPLHHREKTAGRMPVRVVEEGNRNPYNGRRKIGAAHGLYFSGPTFAVELGSFVSGSEARRGHAGFGLAVDRELVLGGTIIDGRLRLVADLRDINNRPLVVVRAGQLRTTTSAWDVEFTGTRLVVRSAQGAIALDMTLDPPDRIAVERASFYNNFVRFHVGPDTGQALRVGEDGGPVFGQITVRGGVGIAVGGVPPGLEAVVAAPDQARAFGAPAAPIGAFRKWHLRPPAGRPGVPRLP